MKSFTLFLLSLATFVTVVQCHPVSTPYTRAFGERVDVARELIEIIPTRTVNTPTPIKDRDLEDAGDAMQTVSSIIDKITPVLDALGPEGEALGEALDVVSTFLDIFGQIFSAIGEEQREDAANRGAFTQSVVEGTLKAHPGWNVVTVYPSHTTNFQGVEGPDWYHNTTSLDTHAGTIKFDIYAARAGIFELNGDGGYMNWAYMGPNIQAVGFQNHRLIFSGAPPSNKPTSGSCGVHITQYQMNEKDVNPVGHYTLVVILKDAKGVVVGFNGNGDVSKPLGVASQLPSVFTISATGKDSDPLSFVYGNDKWDSNTKGRCSVGGYDSGSRQMDCGFDCTF